MPVHLCSSGQLGATSPVTFAGSIVQCIAEVLGGLVYALAISPEARVFLGTWPLVSDLRTGAAAAGSGEQALLSSAACQISRYYNIPNGTVSGISDSKLPDAQAGAEKAMQHGFIGNSGGNLLYCGGGSLATGLGNSQAALVIDNDVIAMAKRTMTLSSSGRIVFDYDMKLAEPILATPEAAAPVDLWPAFHALKGKPLLLLRGELSTLLSARSFADMQKVATEADSAVIPHVGHAPTLDEPEARAAIDALLARVA